MIKKLFKKLSLYPRLRVLLLLVAVVLVFVIVVNLFSSDQTDDAALIGPSKLNQPQISLSKKNDAAGQNYHRLNQRDQAAIYREKIRAGRSIFNNIFKDADIADAEDGGAKLTQSGNSGHASAAAPGDGSAAHQGRGRGSTDTSSGNTQGDASRQAGASGRQPGEGAALSPEDRALAALTGGGDVAGSGETLRGRLGRPTGFAAQEQRESPEFRAATNNLRQRMRVKLQGARVSWANPVMGTVSAPEAKGGTGGATAAAGTALAAGQGPGQAIIKAGTIFYAVIDTALNSDQANTPVLATVVEGPYRNARLIGTFDRRKDRLVIRFNAMSLRGVPHTFGISAFAINGDTLQNSLATDVDNHYMYRFGSLFAAGFLQGFGNAYASYNYTCGTATDCTIYQPSGLQRNDVTFKESLYQGLGQVGTNMANIVQQGFYIPPTVTVEQGTGVGVLFTSDVTINAPVKGNDFNTPGEKQKASTTKGSSGPSLAKEVTSSASQVGQQQLTQAAATVVSNAAAAAAPGG